jgi:hypothetical protein
MPGSGAIASSMEPVPVTAAKHSCEKWLMLAGTLINATNGRKAGA